MTTTTDVPSKHPIGIDGRAFPIDESALPQYRWQTVEPIRQQFDASRETGETSLNPQGFWRRGFQTWHRGAGQEYADKPDSDAGRFWSSSGVDVWTEGKLSLLPTMTETAVFNPGAIASYQVADSPGGAWFVDGVDLKFLPQSSTTPEVALSLGTGNQFLSPVWLANALYVIEANTSTGDVIHKVVRGAANTYTVTPFLDFGGLVMRQLVTAAGRLIGRSTESVYDLSASEGDTALPSPLLSGLTLNIDTLGSASAVGGYIYLPIASGSGLDYQTTIYRTTILPDGTQLGALSVAAVLPSGEYVTACHGHLGISLFIIGIERRAGDRLVLRMAVPEADGSLVIGERFADDDGPSGTSVGGGTLAVSLGRFVYITSRDENSNQFLIRVDPSILNGSAPAWATDVRSGSNAAGSAVIMRDGVPALLTSSLELWEQSTTKVASGSIEFGEINYGLASSKFYAGNELVVEEGGAVLSDTGAQFDSFTSINPTLTLTRGADPDACVTAVTIKALPAPESVDLVQVPLLLFDRPTSYKTGTAESRDTRDDMEYLRSKRNQIVELQEGDATFNAQVLGVDWIADRPSENDRMYQGTALVTMKVLS